MRYYSSQYLERKKIVECLEDMRRDDQEYVDPFCGSCWVASKMSGPKYISDVNPFLIKTWTEFLNGWLPPSDIDEGDYEQHKIKTVANDPLTGYLGFACSKNGKFFDKFVGNDKIKKIITSSIKSMNQRSRNLINDTQIIWSSYKEVFPLDSLVYCDPPRLEGEYMIKKFNWEEFWETMHTWKLSNTIVVSCAEDKIDDNCIELLSLKYTNLYHLPSTF